MTIRDEFLMTNLKRYLDRKGVPQSLQGKPEAQRDEISALVYVLTRYAPNDDLKSWWQRVEIALDENATTRGWPSVADLKNACIANRKSAGRVDTTQLDSKRINAQRILNGEPVGEDWIYGRRAVELIAGGYVTEGDMRPYRKGLYEAMKEVWGVERANEVERDLIARHEAAMGLSKAMGTLPTATVKRMPVPTYED